MEYISGSQTQQAMKEVFRQYSTTVKNETPSSKGFKNMSQSSNLPFDKMYQAFSSSSHLNKMGLERFKNSQAKSIIEKLMQPNEKKDQPQSVDQQSLIFNELHNIDIGMQATSHRNINLSQTENKIFRQVINLVDQIQEINTQIESQSDDFQQLRTQMKQVGLEIPQLQPESPTRPAIKINTLSSQQLQSLYDENQQLERQIDQMTKELSVHASPQNPTHVMKKLLERNKTLNKQLNDVRQEIYSTGEIDDKEFKRTQSQIRNLQAEIMDLQGARNNKLIQNDEGFRYLKQQNDQLRHKTMIILQQAKGSQGNMNSNPRKRQLIGYLKRQEQTRFGHREEINSLKDYYMSLKEENNKLKARNNSYGSPFAGFLDSRLQVQSKVRPFQSADLDKHRFPRMNRTSYNRQSNQGKQNYFENYQPSRNSNKLQLYTRQDNFGHQANYGQKNESHFEQYDASSPSLLNEYEEIIGKMRRARN